jgi:hypothetical protein
MIGGVPEFPFLGTAEVAALPKEPVSRRTVEREIARGNLKATQSGGRLFIDPDEARKWAAQYLPWREQHERHRAAG